MDRTEIKTILPHREPMLLVDEVVKIEDTAYGKYQVTGDEFFLKGHFPERPIVPGVILCEIMAQMSCILLKDDLYGHTPLYRGLDHVKFKRSVEPGDLIEVKAKILQKKMKSYFVAAEASVKGEMCARAEMTFALVPNEVFLNK